MAILILAGCWIADLPAYQSDTPLLAPAPPAGTTVTDPCSAALGGLHGCLGRAVYQLGNATAKAGADAAKAAPEATQEQNKLVVAYLTQLVATLAKQRHFTYIFNTFVFLQLFNEVNCRKVGPRDFNVFEAPFHNYYFLAVAVGTVAVQVALCQLCPTLAGATPLGRSEWGACVAVGATPLVIALLLKLTPLSWVGRLGRILPDEDQATESKLLKTWEGGADPAAAKAAAEDEGAFTQAPE